MRKWAFIVAALAAVLVGCDGGSGGGGGGNVPPPGPSLSRVNTGLLTSANGAFGRIEVTYNTGQGRAPGSPTAVIERLNLVAVPIPGLPAGDSRNNVDTLLNPERRLGLDAYTSQTISVNVPMSNLGFSGPLNSRDFDTFTLDVTQLEIEQDGGAPLVVRNANGAPVVLEEFPAHIVAFAGRTSSLQVFLDDAMLNAVDQGFPVGLVPVFDRDLFEQVNLTDDGNPPPKMLAHIADYIVFDISNVPNKPQMVLGGFASRVWFSGDAIALSGDPVVGSPAPMEVLTPLSPPIEGLFSPSVALPGGVAPGTYSLRQVDPRDLSNLARITALQGTWRDYYVPNNLSQSPFLNVGTFEAFTFPQSIEQEHHDMVVIARNGAGEITNLYFGQMDFSSDSFSIWPIDQVDDGDASNEVSGSISGLLDANGGSASTHKHVRSGTFTITNGGVPSGFASTGRFIVYRL